MFGTTINTWLVHELMNWFLKLNEIQGGYTGSCTWEPSQGKGTRNQEGNYTTYEIKDEAVNAR